MFEDDEETSLAGMEISFQGVEWDEQEGQFQIMEDHNSTVGNKDFIPWRIAEGFSAEARYGKEVFERWHLTSVCRVEVAVGVGRNSRDKSLGSLTYVLDWEIIHSVQWSLCLNAFFSPFSFFLFLLLSFLRITSVLFQYSLNFCKLFMLCL